MTVLFFFILWPFILWPGFSQEQEADLFSEIALVENVFDAAEVDLATAVELVGRSAGSAQIDTAPIGKIESESVTLADVAYLIVEAYGIPAGLMYTVAPGPRYAYRELRFRRLILGDSYEYALVDGRTFLDLLSRIREIQGRS